MVQAVDAARFVHDPQDPAVQAQASFAEQARAVLAQTPGHPVPLEEQVTVCALFHDKCLHALAGMPLLAHPHGCELA